MRRQRMEMGEGGIGRIMMPQTAPFQPATQAAEPQPQQQQQQLVPASVLDILATRTRPGGLFLAMLRPDATLAYHDSGAGLFFSRYVLPMLQYPEPADTELRERVNS